MRHICHVTTVHPLGDARIFYRMCRALSLKGYSIEIIGPGGCPATDGIRCSTWNDRILTAHRPIRIGLALAAMIDSRAEIYHFHDPELLPAALLFKILRRNAAVVFDVHEDYPSMMIHKHWLPSFSRTTAARAAHIGNSLGGRFLDGVVTADPGVYRDFAGCKVTNKLIYYNFPPPDLFRKTMQSEQPESDLVYLGGMSERAGTFLLLDALKLLSDQGLRATLNLGGYTEGKEGRRRVEKAIRDRGLQDQVNLRGRVPYPEVPAWLRQGKIGVVTLQNVSKFLKNIPSKMFEYWACGLPVVASDLPSIAPFVKPDKNGLLFEPGSPEALASCIRRLVEDTDVARSMGAQGRRLVLKKWNNDVQVENLIHFYNRLRPSDN